MTWRAQYKQNEKWHDMIFKTINVVQKPGGSINASGTDEVGEFTFQGCFAAIDTSVRITKIYVGKHSIYYEGKLDLQKGEINGYWGFEAGERKGQFRMKKF